MYESKNYIAIPPGATIKEQLETRGITQKEFALRMGLSEKHISELINGKVELTANVASRLASVLGSPATFWQNLEANYRSQLQKVQEELHMKADMELAKKIPYSKMANLGWVEKTRKPVEKVDNLRKFFEVAELIIIDNLKMPGIAFRVNGGDEDNDYALAAWAQKAKCEARKINTKGINIPKLRRSLEKVRALTTESPSEFCNQLRDILSECGVAIVFVQHLDGSYLQGASFYDGKRIVLGLSVRGKTADIFWFSLFHELYHILEGHINHQESTTAEQEKSADIFARDTLIPLEKYNEFIDRGSYDRESICSYAEKIGIAPGILLGRLQKENKLGFNVYQDLKVKYKIG